MNNYGQQLFKAIGQIKKSNITRLHKWGLGNLKPHEFFMLVTIMNCYEDLKFESDSFGVPPPPGIKISEISRFASISMPGVSQTISTLVRQGYAERITIEADRRLVYVNLTSQGRALEAKVSHSFFQLYDEAATILGPEESQSLITLLDKLSSAFDLIEEKQRDEKQNEKSERKTS